MKKIIIIFLLMLSGVYCPVYGQRISRENNTFIMQRDSSCIIKTYFTYRIGKNSYDIFLNKKSGRTFIYRRSKKTNNIYKYYLPEKVSREICEEYKIHYK